jgi:predicted Zn-dependent protease with MMP-like domain
MRLGDWFSGGGRGRADRVEQALALVRAGDLEAAVATISERFPQALEQLRGRSEPMDAGWLRLAAALEYRSGWLEDAHSSAERSLALEDDAPTWHLLARVRGWLQRPDAEDAFRRAAALEPDNYVVPHRVTREHFAALAEEAFDAIPPEFRARLDNTLVVVDDLPEIDAVREGEDPDLLGVYDGATALDRGLPERIVLYQRNHEQVCSTEAELREEVNETLRHEIGHHFGMEEDELPY